MDEEVPQSVNQSNLEGRGATAWIRHTEREAALPEEYFARQNRLPQFRELLAERQREYDAILRGGRGADGFHERLAEREREYNDRVWFDPNSASARLATLALDSALGERHLIRPWVAQYTMCLAHRVHGRADDDAQRIRQIARGAAILLRDLWTIGATRRLVFGKSESESEKAFNDVVEKLTDAVRAYEGRGGSWENAFGRLLNALELEKYREKSNGLLQDAPLAAIKRNLSRWRKAGLIQDTLRRKPGRPRGTGGAQKGARR
jgi:hypothetical protein